MPTEPESNSLLKPHPNPFTGRLVVWDTTEVYADQEANLNLMSSIGFEPYAISQVISNDPEAIAKAKLSGVPPFRTKMWLKRPREIETQPIIV